METKKITCKECKVEFDKPEKRTRYPRRYCDKCSKERKKAYERIHTVKFEDCDDCE